jgi:uncharacterized protein DUF695
MRDQVLQDAEGPDTEILRRAMTVLISCCGKSNRRVIAIVSRLVEGPMSDEWDFYFANVNDVVASLFVDLGIRDSIPDAQRPWLLWSLVYFRHSRDDGLSSTEEAPILRQIEDALTKAVKEATRKPNW